MNGTDLVNDLCGVFKRHIVLSDASTLACALWTLHAHAHDAAIHSPILDIGSPTKRCGKTQLLAALELLVPKPLASASVSPASVFRSIDRWRPTMLIDEADTFFADKSELRGVLNSGHSKSSAVVVRCVGDQHEPRRFGTWCPKVFAHIGRVHPTLEDRSIRIQMKRKLKTEMTARIPRDDAYAELRSKCARFAEDNLENLKKARPTILIGLNDRAADNWDPLLAIAEACGCGAEARQAALELSGADDDETDAIVLLADLKTIFEQAKAGDATIVTMSSAVIAADLVSMEDKRWPEFKGGKPITPAQIAALLKPFHIAPRKVQSDGGGGKRQVQGYRFEQFEWTFKRYLA